MRVRWSLVAAVLACTVGLAAHENQTMRAQAVPGQVPDAEFSDATAAVKEDSAAHTLEPGQFRFTTGLDKEPQHIQGPVVCGTRDGLYKIALGNPDAAGVEIGLTQDESTLKYVDLGYRNGVSLMLVNDGQPDRGSGQSPPVVYKTGNTYFVSGYATGLTSTQRETNRYFEISVACP